MRELPATRPPTPDGRAPPTSTPCSWPVRAAPTLAAAAHHLAAGRPVVSTSDSIDDVRALLDLDAEAQARAGAGGRRRRLLARATPACSPATPPAGFDDGRPRCTSPAAAPAVRPAPGSTTPSLTGQALDWRDGGWQRRPAGSGRELCWFPDPIGAEDCYRAELPDALLLVPAFPGVERVTARLAATRRDRFSAHLPMLRKPHPEGLVGATRVEVRGRRDGVSEVARARRARSPGGRGRRHGRPGRSAGPSPAASRPGPAASARSADPVPFLTELATVGIKAAVFEGSG